MSETDIQRLYKYICLELKHFRINIAKLKLDNFNY